MLKVTEIAFTCYPVTNMARETLADAAQKVVKTVAG